MSGLSGAQRDPSRPRHEDPSPEPRDRGREPASLPLPSHPVPPGITPGHAPGLTSGPSTARPLEEEEVARTSEAHERTLCPADATGPPLVTTPWKTPKRISRPEARNSTFSFQRSPSAPSRMVAEQSPRSQLHSDMMVMAELQQRRALSHSLLEHIAMFLSDKCVFLGRCTDPPPLSLHGAEISWSRSITYLGVVVNRRLSMAAQVSKARTAARAALSMLSPVFRSRLPLRTKLAIYKTYVRPHLTYAAPAWFSLASPQQVSRLKTVESTALRRASGAPWCVRNETIFRDLRMERLDTHIIKIAAQMFHRADVSHFHHIRDIAPWHTWPPDSSRRRLPRDILPPHFLIPELSVLTDVERAHRKRARP